MKFKILVVNDEDSIHKLVKRTLSGKDYIIEVACNAEKAFTKVDSIKPDLILLDVRLGRANGIDILKILREKYSEILIIMITVYPQIDLAAKAIQMGAYDFIEKPIRQEHLLLRIQRAIERLKLEKDLKELHAMHINSGNLPKIIGNSPEMQQVRSNAEKFAQSDISFFIEGESGTGKKFMVKFIHYQSRRSSKPLVSVDCGAYPEDLLESKLFGCADSAYAETRKAEQVGFVEQAESGTLFLNEIEKMPTSVQVKLLRLLEKKEYHRVGDATLRKTDIRIITASKMHVNEAIKNGYFREDLFDHLSKAKIFLPPLRERKFDILALARYFMDHTNQHLDKHVKGFTKDAERALESYPWEGNVRQLKMIIERAVLFTNKSIIDKDELALVGLGEENIFHIRVKLNTEKRNGNVLRTAMNQIIKKTLDITHGNKSLASQYLGIPRGTFRHHLSKLN